MPDDLIKNSGMKQRAVYDFLKILSNADLVETPHGQAPRKKLEFVPATWVTLLQVGDEEKKQEVVKDGKTTNQ